MLEGKREIDVNLQRSLLWTIVTSAWAAFENAAQLVLEEEMAAELFTSEGTFSDWGCSISAR